MKKLFNHLIFEALKVKATDIHFTLMSDKCICEFRGIHGFINYENEQLNHLFQYLK